MPSLLKRVLFQVGDAMNERTITYSSVSNDGHCISIRPFTKPTGEKEEKFPIEWAFACTNKDVKVTKLSETSMKQDFDFLLDTNRYLAGEHEKSGDIVETQWDTWESGLILEHGVVYPHGKDKEGVAFKELWQPLDCSIAEETILASSERNDVSRSIVLRTEKSEKWDGLIIVTGRYVQGILLDKTKSDVTGISILRLVETGAMDSFSPLVVQGENTHKFPKTYGKLELEDVIKLGGIGWEVIECHNQ
ncbi:hypothetical protein TPHA_0F02800 [Tetrapisispora phaffii CBS 4417]|uniref:Protein HRI1 n=1 Tax=Tetrapisispora phaffii (strain ATCC 24235 / CBS 4417 / NBRC 1672 / NRRL Y-8282 / UCD 70-5) TaxID=1071381 RepID=G8BUH5_TETPH|nr:hypothetical protein TPHA_0F02800 [Tetrapisispora phaffii CBS 4417]CCE63761.1 hypothetical protein TPHA_0F02800 [Tetrapisispora phaffii CBS 4417]